jgi:hypothetical protein
MGKTNPLGRTDRPWDGTNDESPDTEGHDLRAQYPIPPNVDGDGDGGIGRRLSHEMSDEPDTEGHIMFRRRPGEGGE